MNAGTATVDITPEVGCELSGYVARVQPSVGLHTRLRARALYLEAEGHRLLWLHAELIGFERAFVEELKRRLRVEMGLAAHEIAVSATHTHAGPCTIRLNNCGDYDEAYVIRLREKMLDAARRAERKTEPVAMVATEGRSDLAMDRRAKASAHTDPRVGVLGWKRNDGDYVAVLANYAVHNVALSSDNRHISGDLFGCAASDISKAMAGNPAVLFTNGACGNLNPPHHTEDFAQLEAWGGELAQSVLEALHRATPCAPRIQSASEVLAVPLDTGDAEAVRRWGEALMGSACGGGNGRDAPRPSLPTSPLVPLRRGIEGDVGTVPRSNDASPGATMAEYVGDRIQNAASTWMEEMLARYESGSMPNHATMELQAIRLGPVRLVCMGAEVFSTMADELRAALGAPTYLVGYANGEIGYLPTEAAYAEGGYEVDSAFIFYNSFRPRREAFAMVLERAIALARGLGE